MKRSACATNMTACDRLAAEGAHFGCVNQDLRHWCEGGGRQLHDHVRWEERILFQAIQQRATAQQLEVVERVTAEI